MRLLGELIPGPRAWLTALAVAVLAFALVTRPDTTGQVVVTSPLWPASSDAYAASANWYLRIPQLTGDATATGFQGQVQIDSWAFGVGRHVSSGAGGGN